MQRIGLYGGTFNPVHKGHLLLAQQVFTALKLDRLLFIPAAFPPHKKASVNFHHRCAMLEQAVDTTQFDISNIEEKLPQPSYTFHTLRHFHQEYPDSELWWLMGEDALQDLYRWYRVENYYRYTRLAVVSRPGYPRTPIATLQKHHPKLWSKIDRIESQLPDVSSSSLRSALQNNPAQCPEHLPLKVYAYIREHGLYTN